ncbi:TPA: hypothetical protein ACOEHL_002080, partial [Enterobacter hormaechei subsp. xiangfangensis]
QSRKGFPDLFTVLNKIGYQPSVNQLFPATVKPPVSEVNGGVKIPAEQQFRSGIASMKVRSVPKAELGVPEAL